MKLAIMQPYAFPYLGYFQLIKAVDRFVLLDDVDFIKRGWINRNALADQNGSRRFTIPVNTPKRGQLISTMRLHEPEANQRRLLTTIHHVYHRAPYYQRVLPVLERAINFDGEDLTAFLHHTLDVLTDYLGIETPMFRASERHPRGEDRGKARIIEMCHAEGAEVYVNPEGGTDLYERAPFDEAGIELKFLVHQPRPYRQNTEEFIPRLSIIDAMMFNGPEAMAQLLDDYEFTTPPE